MKIEIGWAVVGKFCGDTWVEKTFFESAWKDPKYFALEWIEEHKNQGPDYILQPITAIIG